MNKKKHKGIPNIGRGVQVGYFKPDPQSIKGKSKYKCVYFNEESRTCSALNHIGCVGVNHRMCKYVEDNEPSKPLKKPTPSGVVNNGTTVTLKEVNTGKEIKIKVNSHINPEHTKLLGKGLKSNSIVENWEGHTYLVWEIKH